MFLDHNEARKKKRKKRQPIRKNRKKGRLQLPVQTNLTGKAM